MKGFNVRPLTLRRTGRVSIYRRIQLKSKYELKYCTEQEQTESVGNEAKSA